LVSITFVSGIESEAHSDIVASLSASWIPK
jgi:hypothetical protein